MTIAQLSAAIAVVAAIGGGAWALDERYAKVDQVAGNSQAILLIQIRNAKASGNAPLVRSLCDDFRRLYGWTPAACR